MNRREFMKAAAGVACAAGLRSLPAQAQAQPQTPLSKNMKNWIWTDVDRNASTEEVTAKYKTLKAHGIDGVFIGGGIDDRAFAAVKEAGLELHTWMWTTNRGDAWIRENHPEWYQVSRTGKSCFDHPPYVDYYRWVNPLIPGVQRYLEDRVEELAAHEHVDGVHLDYVRYPDIILPRGLWEHYHLDQTEELPEYDFSYDQVTRDAFKNKYGRDPMDIKDPAHDAEWLHFRYNAVTELVKKLHRVTKGHNKLMTAAVFPTPHMARKICRQDWDKWPLDAVCPMTYHSFYLQGVDWIGDCVLENIQSVLFPVYAGLYMPDFKTTSDFAEALKVVKHNGGSGVSLFGGVGPEYWAEFEKWKATL